MQDRQQRRYGRRLILPIAIIAVSGFFNGGFNGRHPAFANTVTNVEQTALKQTTMVDELGTIRVPEHEVPLSFYMSDQAKQAFVEKIDAEPSLVAAMGQGIEKYRSAMDQYFYTPRLNKAKSLYPVVIKSERLAGVRVDTVVPEGGVAKDNRHKVLVNLHGGGFSIGAGLGALVESVPLAGLAKIKVVSIDYRQGPEHEFPAASEDVASVYRALLKDYKAESIGFYGCSAGGVLSAMTIAWLQKENLPRPAAIGIFCAGADNLFAGDSRYFANALSGQPVPPPQPNPPPTGMPYVADEDLYKPLVSPVFSPEVLAGFPPTLFVTGTRDGGLSAAVNSHRELVKLDVEADLHVWDGMWHGFIYDVDLPESLEAYEVIVKFFDRHLQP